MDTPKHLDFSESEVPDNETQALLDEIKKEAKPDETETKKEEKPKEVPKEETPKEESKDKKDSEDEPPEAKDESDEDESEADEKKEKKFERKPREKEPWQEKSFKRQLSKKEEEFKAKEEELLSQIESLKKTPGDGKPAEKTNEQIDKIKALAEKHNADEELLTELVKMTSKTSIPAELQNAVAELENIKKARQLESEDRQFDNEFAEVGKNLQEKFPHMKEGDLEKAKSKLNQYYFSARYNNYPLEDIINSSAVSSELESMFPVGKKSAESSSSGKTEYLKGGKDFAEWGDEDIENASKKEFEEYSAWADTQGKR